MQCYQRLLKILAALALCALVRPAAAQTVAQLPPVPRDAITSMTKAMPAKALKPPKARKLLVFTHARGFIHGSIPYAAEALKIMGEKTGAFSAEVSDDLTMIEPANLKQFDAICFDSTTGDMFTPYDFAKMTPEQQKAATQTEERLKKSLLDFVASGKGIVGIHAATDCYGSWPAYGELIGGYFDGHPWTADKIEYVKVIDPLSPLARPMPKRSSFKLSDEIYQMKDPYSRAKVHELLALDTSKTDMTLKGINRKDGDFPISWIRTYGQGRVFYCSLGHNAEIYWTPALLKYYLGGIQYALGDLKANATPSAKAAGGK